MALSILSQAEKSQSSDFAATKATIENLKANFLSSFKKNAVASTDAALAEVMAKLQSAGTEETALKQYVSSVEDGIKRIKAYLMVAGRYSDEKATEYRAKIADAERRLAAVNAEIRSGLTATISEFQSKLADKETFLNSTGTDLNNQLGQVKQLVRNAQIQLRKNLLMYQAKIDGVVDQIRSYMNLSANADELAISHGIATQLASINKTEIQLASIRAGVEDKLSTMQRRHNSTSQKTGGVLNELIDTAMDVSSSAANAKLSTVAKLTAVGIEVDQDANAIRDQLIGSKTKFEAEIAANKNKTKDFIDASEAEQARKLIAIQDQAAAVENQSRKRFIENLGKIGSLNDDLRMTTTQLAQLLSNANGTIEDISATAMEHMNLSFTTLYNLNKAENRKVASVSDVMNAFSSVVLMFLNETDVSMRTVMGQMDTIDRSSKGKLGAMQRRTDDEVSWIGGNLNDTYEKFKLGIQQERAVQEGLKNAVAASRQRLVAVRQREDADIASIRDGIAALEQHIRDNGQKQIATVRGWIAKRSPQIAKKLLDSRVASLLERNATESGIRRSVVRDIRKRMHRVQLDLTELRHEKQ